MAYVDYQIPAQTQGRRLRFMEKWMVSSKRADFDAWSEKFHITPVLARIIRNRDVTTEEEVNTFLNGSLKDCPSPFLMKDMERAVEAVWDAIISGIHIRVIGDYDVDGICASYILTKGLRALGATVDTAIPHRIHDGYGLNENLIEEARADGIGLIVTCDNGIAAAKQIALANSYGIQVVVTDHHEVPFEIDFEAEGVHKDILPPAIAVVDPKRQDCEYPFSGICGGVVAYKLIQALTTRKELPEDLMGELLEFAAFATVCDVMELKSENRIIVKEGLERMRDSANLGLKSLLEVNQIEISKLSAYHLGFVIGPCLNATGRLDTAKRSLELLFSETKVEAMQAAKELKELNDSRKNLTVQGVEEAERYILENGIANDDVMLVYLPEVHESLAGIIAGRIKEKYYHPVFVLTKAEEGVKGSGRSIEGYHMYEKMCEVSGYFTKFGGHAMAAGLSMEEKDIENLRRALNENSGMQEEDFVPRVQIDVPMPMGYANLPLAKELELLEPHGVGNPKPLFAEKNVTFLGGTLMGTNKNFGRYRFVSADGFKGQMVFFGNVQKFGDYLDEKFGPGSAKALYEGRGNFPLAVTYQLGINQFRGNTELQFLMQNYL